MTSTLEPLVSVLRKRDGRISLQRQSPGAKQGAFRAAIFNGAIEPGGLALAACEDEAAVQYAVRAAADEGVPIAVVAGGHDVWARGFVDRNLILDLRRMSQVSADPAAGEVTIAGGALTRHLLAALPNEMVTVTGTILSVGVTGLAIGGGYGTVRLP